MTLLQQLSLAATLTSATFAVAASIPQNASKTIQPENVVRCEPGPGCLSQTLFGRSYKVINTPRFTVMISISNEGVYTRADVSIANHTDTPLNMSPEDFRVEVVTPKPKVLLYVPPANLVLPPPPAPKVAATPAPQPTAAASFVPQSAALTTPAAASANPLVGEADPGRRRSKGEGSRRQGRRREAPIGNLNRPQRSHPGPGLLRPRQEIATWSM